MRVFRAAINWIQVQSMAIIIDLISVSAHATSATNPIVNQKRVESQS
jgi:hypothetical protein